MAGMRHLGGAMLSSLLVFLTADYRHPGKIVGWRKSELPECCDSGRLSKCNV
jgi:hypothetical protein